MVCGWMKILQRVVLGRVPRLLEVSVFVVDTGLNAFNIVHRQSGD
jgi:hypothetical protein